MMVHQGSPAAAAYNFPSTSLPLPTDAAHQRGLGQPASGAATTTTTASAAPQAPQAPADQAFAPCGSASYSASYSANSDACTAMLLPPPVLGKRKAETQDNEQLSKRLSLLNLEKGGSKLYVPVESPAPAGLTTRNAPDNNNNNNNNHDDDSMMQLDHSQHRVYIYNLDDELSSESGHDDDDDADGKLILLPDVEKHLRERRIPPHVLANSQGQLAGMHMQLVPYSDPKSLTVPEEHDSVRKAIIEARQRARDKQRLEREATPSTPFPTVSTAGVVMSSAVDKGDEMDID
ncbi:uncharacterized protein UV8b_05702 [Ustilaginoidea virens]|uniref:Uncharacterized protein n=1 Tax=Ustilaginoidea virens TaxID=1159556 RepID=A0A8E5HTW4_USTVR|nr:uncharacterized protein UV8b_05702 [Ustilaginoidea virens]QUC21459.1 hypothetical protein UV8b_05702 [Ustilaginoidea virens]